MKISVIGAGIIGVTTAYELAVDGHEVTVFERRSAAAEETSFANAGVIAPGYVTPWAAPGMPRKVLRQMLGRHSAVKLGLGLSMADLHWIWRWLRACQPEAYLAHRAHLQRLAFYSRERLHQVTADLKLEYDRSDGYLVLFRSEYERKMAQAGLQLLRDSGSVFSELTETQARALEPALNPDTPFAGALSLPQDEVGNCRQFALLLKNECQRLGVKFSFGTQVAPLEPSAAASLRIEGQAAIQAFDAVVVCAGLASLDLLRPTGIQVPMTAVCGYSLSAPIREPLNAPRSAVMDERFKVAISRLGNRVRVAGSAEIGGTLARHRASSVQTLYKVLHDWFPGAATQSSAVQIWKGARPMLSHRPPLIGQSAVPGLWLNLGHGSSGWALSCGSARALADLMGQKKPGIDLTGFDAHAPR